MTNQSHRAAVEIKCERCQRTFEEPALRLQQNRWFYCVHCGGGIEFDPVDATAFSVSESTIVEALRQLGRGP